MTDKIWRQRQFLALSWRRLDPRLAVDFPVDTDHLHCAKRKNQCLRTYVQKEAILAKPGDCRTLELEAFVACADGERYKRISLEQEREFFDHRAVCLRCSSASWF